MEDQIVPPTRSRWTRRSNCPRECSCQWSRPTKSTVTAVFISWSSSNWGCRRSTYVRSVKSQTNKQWKWKEIKTTLVATVLFWTISCLAVATTLTDCERSIITKWSWRTSRLSTISQHASSRRRFYKWCSFSKLPNGNVDAFKRSRRCCIEIGRIQRCSRKPSW